MRCSAILIVLAAALGLCFGLAIDGEGVGRWVGLVIAFTAVAVVGRMQERGARRVIARLGAAEKRPYANPGAVCV